MRRWVLRILGSGAVVVAGQALAALLWPVPRFEEFDASGRVGSAERHWRWVVVGDSTTTGPGVSGPDDIWVRQLAERFCQDRSVDIISLAVGGARSRDVLRDQLDRAVSVPADIAFVSVGANDVLKGVPAREFAHNLDVIVRRLAEAHSLVVVSGVGDLGTIPRLYSPFRDIVRRRGRRFDLVATSVANRHGVAKVDQWTLTAPPFRSTPGVFSADLFHPTAIGHRIWADAVEATIRPRLRD